MLPRYFHYQVHQVRDWYSGVAIKMGRRQGATSGAYLNRYVTEEQCNRRPIFIATPRADASFGSLLCRSSVEDHSGYSPSSLRASSQNTQRRRYTSHGLGALEPADPLNRILARFMHGKRLGDADRLLLEKHAEEKKSKG